MMLSISPHDISLPLSLVSSYPQSSLMPDHGETLWHCYPQKQLLFISPLWTVSFWSSLLHFSLSLVFSFVLYLLLVSVAVVCEPPLHVHTFPMITGSLMHIPAQRFGLSELQMLSGGFIETPLLWRADDDRSSIGFGVFPDQTIVLLTPRVSDKPVWTSPK